MSAVISEPAFLPELTLPCSLSASCLSGFGGLETTNSTAGGFNFGGFGLAANPAVNFNIGNFGVSTTSTPPFNFGNSLASAGRYCTNTCSVISVNSRGPRIVFVTQNLC